VKFKISFAVVMLFSIISIGYAGNGHRAEYWIATTEWAGWSPLDVADALGFWEDAGLKVTLVHYHWGPVLIDVIRSGKVDLSCNMVGDVVGMHNQTPSMVILAEIDWSHGGDLLIQKKGFDLAGHKGGPVGIHYDSPAIWYFMDKFLEKKGMGFLDFRIVELPPQDLVAQFVAGRMPFIQHYEPFAGRAIRQGNGEVVATSADFPGIIPECMYGLASRVSRIPDRDIECIIRGWIRAAQWSNDPKNWDQYARILSTRTLQGTGPHTDAQLKSYFKAIRIHSTKVLKQRNRPGGGLEKHLLELWDFMKISGRINHWKTPLDILDTRHLTRVLSADEKTKALK
jgi:NitT/TauT family transport system substrate-binding protein